MSRRITFAGIGGLSLLFPQVASAAASASAACDGAKAAGATCTGTDFNNILGNILNALFFIVGVLAVGVLIYGGIRYVTSTGDPRRIQAAKDTVIYGIVGLILAILARSIVFFVIARVK